MKTNCNNETERDEKIVQTEEFEMILQVGMDSIFCHIDGTVNT